MKFLVPLCAFAALCLPLAAQNQALSLTNGVDGYVLVPNNPSLAPAQITCEAWVIFNTMNLSGAGVYPTILRKNSAPGQEVYFLRVQQGTGRLAWKVRLPGVASAMAVSPAALPVGTWTHVAGTWNGSIARLYINGTQVASATGTGALNDLGGDLQIGKGDASTGGGEVWNGLIDEVRLWSTARTPAQILSTLNWQIDGQPGLVSAWHFNGNLADTSGPNSGSGFGTLAFSPSGLNLFNGTPPYQVNGSAASFDLDGVQGDAFSPAIVNRTFTSCAAATPQANFQSSFVGQPWELAYTAGPAVAAPGLGIVTPGGQRFNLNIADPTLGFLNGFAFTVPFAPLSIPLSIPTNFDITAQMVIIAPGPLDGFALSAASELHVTQGATSIGGPTFDDSAIKVLLSNPAFCNPPSTIPFYGVSYTDFDVISNGRVMFGAPTFNTSFTPTVATAMTNYPFVGSWCDLNPGLGGSIVIATTAPGVVEVQYNAINYFATTIPNTFKIILDGLTGIVSIDGLSGIAPHTFNQFLGISPGILGPATDPGQTAFITGGPFTTTNLTDMIYRFGTTGSLVPGLSRLDFIPSGTGYGWVGL